MHQMSKTYAFLLIFQHKSIFILTSIDMVILFLIQYFQYIISSLSNVETHGDSKNIKWLYGS